MSTERNIRFDLIARLCPNTTGAELRSVCTEAGMYAIRQRRKVASEKDFLDAVEKVIRQGSKFSSSGVSIFFRWSFPIIAAVLTKVCYSYSSINNTTRRRRHFTQIHAGRRKMDCEAVLQCIV